MAQQCKILFGCCASPAGGWGPGILQDCMTGQSTWVCSGLPFEVCKLRLEEYGVNIFRAVVGSSSNSISLGRTPELLVFGLRVCVGLGSSDRSLGLGFSYKLEVAGQHANGPGLFLMIPVPAGRD